MKRRVFLAALLASTALARPGFANFGHRRVNAVGGGGSDVFIIAFQVKNTGVGSAATPQVSFFQPLAPGALTSGNKLELRASNGVTVIPMQQDQEPSWQSVSSSVKGAAISFVSPDTFSAGQTITYRLYSVPGSPDRTPAVSLAQLAANSDFKMQFTGQDLGADTFQVKVNDVITDNNNWPWGSNPMQGYEVIRAGPICSEWRFWSYLRRTSDSAWHRWIKGWVYVRAWGVTGPWEVSCGVRQSNILGASASGTVGAIPETKHVFDVTILDGATVLQRWGGASDARVQAVNASAFDPATNLITLSSSNVLTNGTNGGMAVTLSGTVGAGLSTSTVYWLAAVTFSTTQYFLATTRTNAANAIAVDFTTAGSGTINIIPHSQCYPFTGQLYLDNTARPLWRSGTRPTVAVAHDFSYLTQQTRAVPPYLPGITINPVASALAHSPGQQFYQWDLNGTGAGPNDERFGYLNVSESRALYIPFDTNNNQQCRVIAATFAEQHVYLEDETVGVIPVMNNGPAKNGVPYPNLGACRPARAWPLSQFNSPAWLAPSAAAIDGDGIIEAYSVWMGSGTHCPMPGQIPYLQSGDDFWREYMLHIANMEKAFMYNGTIGDTVSGTAYYTLAVDFDYPPRGVGWGVRLMGQSQHFMPASNPIAAYWSDVCSDNAAYSNAWRQTVVAATGNFSQGTSTNYAALGVPTFSFHNISENHDDQMWMHDIAFLGLGMEAWRNEFPGWAGFINNYYYKYVPGRYDAALGLGGCRFACGQRHTYPIVSGDLLYTNWNSIWNNTSNAEAGGGGLPFPWTGCPTSGLATDPFATVISGPNSIVNYATMGLAMWSMLNGGAGAVTLYNQIRAIQYANVPPLSFTDYPQFAIGPLGAVN